MNDREYDILQEDLQFQREEQLRRFQARNEVNLGLENQLRHFQLPINLGLLRRVLAKKETSERVYYTQIGRLKGQDFVSRCVESDNFRLFANLETDPNSLEVRRVLKISELSVLYKGYNFSSEFLAGTQGMLVSPSQEIAVPYAKKGRFFGFSFPAQELIDDKYTFQFQTTFHLGFARIPFHTDENLPQDYI
jgi:hypothetical protein